ncbi:pH-response regulator protein palI/RIM9-like [Stegastes partitus]|uniref:PH-response regulator protein palI/RIM9-like n=1 Tax=Stegastes partitus TaxID=144197 RepID=A0A3B4Z4C6_9TELE|nr:PREDICTED: pH-response regulator protein palI/RIM9-like [Stegastes partitus]
MKLNPLSVLCLSLLLLNTPFSLAKKGGGGGFGKSFSSKKTSTSNRGSTHTNSNTGKNTKQPGQTGQGNYPRQPGAGGHPNQNPGSPYGGGYGGQGGYGGYGGQGGYGRQGGYGGYGGYGGQGGYGGYGSYGGGYINKNPNNKILSPQYGGSYGYWGYGTGYGSPFSHSVKAMGYGPSDKSRGFGRTAVVAAAGGAAAGMAVGYGIGKFPRPHFPLRNPQEEHYYNHYMYRRYGTKSTDTNDYSRDYRYDQPPETYDTYMDKCMKRNDLLPANRKPAVTPAAKSTTTTVIVSASDVGSNSTETNSSAAGNTSTPAPSTPRTLNQPEVRPVATASVAVGSNEVDDTVSIVEIGYPALIEQLKARRCLELYMIYSEKYLKRQTGGVQGLEMGLRGLLAVVTSTILMLLNSNMLTLLH